MARAARCRLARRSTTALLLLLCTAALHAACSTLVAAATGASQSSGSSSSSGARAASAASSSSGGGSGILFLSLSLRGHLVPLTRLASELADRGHKVTIAVQEDGREYVNKTGQPRFVSLGRLPYAKAERREKLKQICHDNSFLRGFLSLLSDIYLPNAAPMYKALHSIVARDRPELIILDVACVGGLDIAHHFGIPYIINHPSLPLRLEHEPHALSASHTGTGARTAAAAGAGHASLLERALNYLYPRLVAVASTPTLMEVNRLRWSHDLPLFHAPAHVFEAIPTQLEASSARWTEEDEAAERGRRAHSTLLPAFMDAIVAPSHSACRSANRGPEVTLINTAFGLEHAYPLPQNVVLTGPLMPSGLIAHPMHDASVDDEQIDDATNSLSLKTAQGPSAVPSLAPSLLGWLDKSSKPVILVLFGSGTMSYLDGWQVKALAAGLTDSRFRVLWALRTDGKNVLSGAGGGGASLPNSFRIKTNFPQLGAIAHKQVRLVVSPCGAATVHESLYYGKPLLCLPLFGDQLELSSRVVASGAGLALDKWHLEVSDLSKQLLSLVRNVTFRNNAKRLGKILRATGGTKLAADTVQRVLHQQRHKLLLQPEQLQCWHQVYQLDLWALLFAGFIVAILAVRCIFILAAAGARALVAQRAGGETEGVAELTWKQVTTFATALQFGQQLLRKVSALAASSSASASGTAPAIFLNGNRTSFPPNSASVSAASPAAESSATRARSDSLDSMDSNGSNGAAEDDQQLRQRQHATK